MKAQTIDWSDVPYVLAVREAGSLSAASRLLGVNHSTVFRRSARVHTSFEFAANNITADLLGVPTEGSPRLP